MNNQEQKNSLSEKVISKIKSGDIKMKPRIYFIFKMVLLGLGAFFLFLFVVFFISFIIFNLRITGLLFLPRFGFHGVGILFGYLPWALILIVGVLIVALEIFSKRFSFVYRRPIVYSLLVIIVLGFLVGFLIEKTHLHSNLFLSARDRHLPVMGPFYRNFGAPPIHNVHRGIVSEIIDNGFKIETPREETLTIIIAPETRILSDETIKQGDEVVIFGERSDGTVNAFEIRQIEKDFNLFPPDQIPRGQPHFEQ
ncbi:MAG: hypothetical protein NTU58_03640 [Candidatus Nealsonbacteria bacterium]|nr:hypothetical protein [Candidatus Nealsonbacteria bacterium]